MVQGNMKIKSDEKQLKDSDIVAFENRNNISLPKIYKAFLLKNNGGFPVYPLFVNEDSSLYINYFFSIGSGDTNIDNEIKIFPYEISSELLPIGIENNGFLLLDINTDAIYHCDLESIEDKVDFENITFLSKDINSFLDSLVSDKQFEIVDPIEVLAKTHEINHVDEFLVKNDINRKSKNNRTLAQEAAINGNLEVLKRCYELKADMKNVIHYAAKNLHIEVIDFLLSIGIDINERDEYGKTPLTYVFPFIARDFDEYLKSKGAIRD